MHYEHEKHLYKELLQAYDVSRGSVRQASAKRTLRKAPPKTNQLVTGISRGMPDVKGEHVGAV